MNPPGSSSGALSIDTPLAIVGAGTVGTAIAHSAALAGHRVRLFDAQPGRVSIIRTGDPLQPFHVSTAPSRDAHVEVEIVS